MVKGIDLSRPLVAGQSERCGFTGILLTMLASLAVALVGCTSDATVDGSDARSPDIRQDWFGPEDDAGGPDATPIRSYPLPSTIDFSGEAGPMVSRDLDGDGFKDIASLVAHYHSTQWEIVIVWGDAAGRLDQRTHVPLPGDWLPAYGVSTVRDLPSSVLSSMDFIGNDGRDELLTASGLIEVGSDREVVWHELPRASDHLGTPARGAVLGGKKHIVRGTVDGIIEICESLTHCVPLPGQPARPCAGLGPVCMTEELEVADFDGDGLDDVLDSVRAWDIGEMESRLWLGSDAWQSNVPLAIDGGDIEIGDMNGDGLTDLVAQRHEFISDFPSYTDVWISDPTGPEPFKAIQQLYNFDNHNDNAALADIDGDGCLDYVMTGVDDGTAYKLGVRSNGTCTGYIGSADANEAIPWSVIDRRGSIGVQVLDLNGDGILEALVRNSFYGNRGSASVFVIPLP